MCSRCFIHFEETFHLPTFPIEFCYGQVGVSEVVGQESIDIACGIILINDHAESVWIPLGGFGAGEPDDRVAYKSRLRVNRGLRDGGRRQNIHGSCYEKRQIKMEMIEQLFEVNISLVHKIVNSRLYGTRLITLES